MVGTGFLLGGLSFSPCRFLNVISPSEGLFELPPSMVAVSRGQVSQEKEPGGNFSTFYDFTWEVLLVTFAALFFRSGSIRLKRMGCYSTPPLIGRVSKDFWTCVKLTTSALRHEEQLQGLRPVSLPSPMWPVTLCHVLGSQERPPPIQSKLMG